MIWSQRLCCHTIMERSNLMGHYEGTDGRGEQKNQKIDLTEKTKKT